MLIFCDSSLGVFIARGKEDALVTKNIVPGESVYGEKRISVDVSSRPLFPVCSRMVIFMRALFFRCKVLRVHMYCQLYIEISSLSLGKVSDNSINNV